MARCCQHTWQMNPQQHAALFGEALANTAFRHTLESLSDAHMQTVVMSISAVDGGIKREIHATSSQLISVVDGVGWLYVDNRAPLRLTAGITALVSAGSVHQVARSEFHGDADLKLFTIYTPPLHSGVSKQVARRSDDIEE